MFILNGMVFLIIGLQLPEIVEGLKANGVPLSTAIGYGLLVTGVLITARIISSYAALITTMIFRPKVAPRGNTRRQTWLLPLLLGWTGMRGVVSLAAALAIPVTLSDGSNFPHRSLILFITFVVILLTLVVQGLTLPVLIRRSRLFDIVAHEDPEEEMLRRIRGRLRDHTLGFLRQNVDGERPEHAGLRHLVTHWENKASTSSVDAYNEHTRQVMLEMLESQRQHLVEINRDPAVDEEMVRQELYLIDLEEERLRMKL